MPERPLESSLHPDKRIKEARTEAEDLEIIATLQIDWSENPKLWQSQEEKSAYYFYNLISLHAMYLWTKEKKQSIASLSDSTDHKVAAADKFKGNSEQFNYSRENKD